MRESNRRHPWSLLARRVRVLLERDGALRHRPLLELAEIRRNEDRIGSVHRRGKVERTHAAQQALQRRDGWSLVEIDLLVVGVVRRCIGDGCRQRVLTVEKVLQLDLAPLAQLVGARRMGLAVVAHAVEQAERRLAERKDHDLNKSVLAIVVLTEASAVSRQALASTESSSQRTSSPFFVRPCLLVSYCSSASSPSSSMGRCSGSCESGFHE